MDIGGPGQSNQNAFKGNEGGGTRKQGTSEQEAQGSGAKKDSVIGRYQAKVPQPGITQVEVHRADVHAQDHRDWETGNRESGYRCFRCGVEESEENHLLGVLWNQEEGAFRRECVQCRQYGRLMGRKEK